MYCRCVFPEAYSYTWENKRSRFGAKLDDYELHMAASFAYEKEEERRSRTNFSAARLTERGRIFYATLLSMVKDHHRKFLQGIDIDLDEEK